MKFDIKAHLQNHAYYFKQVKEINKSDLHFNFSFLDLQFFKIDQTPENTLFELLEELKKEASYKVKNGYYLDKQGNKRQKYTTRRINLQDAIKIEAIHTEGADGEYVMPHIHLMLSPNARLGKDYSLLKTHIIEVSKKFNLRPNFAEIAPNNPASYKNLAKSVKNFSWIIRKMPNKDFKNYVANRLADKLNKLTEYTLLSGNLQYYIKTLEFIKKRLNRQRIDFNYKEHNLRDTYPLPLTKEDMQVIELINKKDFTQKAIKPYLNNAIMRDFIRYSYFKDKNKALIINSLSKQTNLLENLRPNKRIIDNYSKLYEKTLNQDKQKQLQEQQKEKKVKSIKEILKDDLLEVAKNCINEKELRQAMQKLGYAYFGFKKKSGKIFAYQFKLPNEDKKIVVKCSDSISISEIRAILKENFIKSKKNENIRANISNEHSLINTYTFPKPLKTPQPVPVTYKTQQIQEKKEKHKILIKQRREYATNYKRIRELIANARENSQRELEIKRAVTGDARRERNNQNTITDLATNARENSSREYSTARKLAKLAGEKLSTIGRTLGRIGEKITNTINAINKFLNTKKEKEQKINELLSDKKTENYLYGAFGNKEFDKFINEKNIDFIDKNIHLLDELFKEFLLRKDLEEIEKAVKKEREKQQVKKALQVKQHKNIGMSR